MVKIVEADVLGVERIAVLLTYPGAVDHKIEFVPEPQNPKASLNQEDQRETEHYQAEPDGGRF